MRGQPIAEFAQTRPQLFLDRWGRGTAPNQFALDHPVRINSHSLDHVCEVVFGFVSRAALRSTKTNFGLVVANPFVDVGDLVRLALPMPAAAKHGCAVRDVVDRLSAFVADEP